MQNRVQYVGQVFRLRDGMGLPTHGNVPGKVPLVLSTETRCTVAYFDPSNRPRVGSRIGAQGTWLALELEPERTHPEYAAIQAGRLKLVNHQLAVQSWSVLPEDASN